MEFLIMPNNAFDGPSFFFLLTNYQTEVLKVYWEPIFLYTVSRS